MRSAALLLLFQCSCTVAILPAIGWTRLRFPCDAPVPPAPIYGSVRKTIISSRLFTYTLATYSCYSGYKLVGKRTLVCHTTWIGAPPVCVLAVFDSARGSCDFTYGSNCVYLNNAGNVFQWVKETKTTTTKTFSGSCYKGIVSNSPVSTTESNLKRTPLPTISMGFPSKSIVKKKQTEEAKDSAKPVIKHPVRRLSRLPTLSCANKGIRVNKITTTRSTASVLAVSQTVSNQVFEVGPFLKGAINAYIKFSFAASNSLAYHLYVYAHCLPDPPGHLDQVGSLDPRLNHKAFQIFAVASSGSHTVCLNLRDTVGCNSFAMRFSATILHLTTASALLVFTPRGVHRSVAHALCPGTKAANEG